MTAKKIRETAIALQEMPRILPGSKAPKRGRIPTSKVVAAVRGMANSGPIHRRMAKLKAFAKGRLTFPANLSILPPALNVASSPSKGIPIPVTAKPKRPVGHFVPEIIPI